MSVEEAVRSVWTPGDQVVESESGLGREPRTSTYTAPAKDLLRHRLLLAALTLASLAVGPLAHAFGTGWVPPVLLTPIVLTSGLLLRVPAVVVVLITCSISAVATLSVRPEPAQLAIVAVTAALALRLARNRDSVGLHGMRGDQTLLDLKARLKATNQLPALPLGWGRKVGVQAAAGALFGGDFLVAHHEAERLRVALVDVSGKGDDAAAHALMLSGGFGGLLASLPADEFLPACNAYLTRGREGRLVTAIHLDLDLFTGRYEITCAGHPPAVHYCSGSGSWQPSPARGIALGVVEDASWAKARGTLQKGDALMLFTNGAFGPRTDPETGVDRLLGEADTLVQRGFAELATIVKHKRNTEDDSALVLIWRT
ncbi:PP2C family protein-serine/threonine phosphatase [Thermoactinospora rubra]|uniref:PP2C family protein-serine/threonine phosphatase n=1 Tax=Thermoactinospora rubra TaxID=1088767 RepID=UPI00117F042F|nr:PP2C family protein-serine/threonine phosphatase [Thermoactinospora rubra]